MIGAALHFWRTENRTSREAEAHPPEAALPATENSTTHFNVTAPTPQPTPIPQGPLPKLGPHLREIGDCLEIKNSLNDDADLSMSSLQDSVKGELGELVVNDTDWKNVHVTLPNGEKRRLRIEVEGLGEESSGQRLHYYGVDKEDLPVPLPLSDEQSLNPSPEYVASLENQGKVTLREEARRGLYSKGAELYSVERNGSLSELELSYHGKGVKCQDLQNSQGACSCF